MRTPILCLCLLAAPAFAAAKQSGTKLSDSAAVTGATHATPAAAADAHAEKRNAIEKKYRADLVRTLSASNEPRDQVLAVVIGIGIGVHVDDALVAHAAAAAPNDALVQWIALTYSDRPSAPLALGKQALARMQALEPDNASVWVQALTVAARQQDAGVVDGVMRRMAESTHSNEHFFDLQNALNDMFKRHPITDEYFTAAGSTPADSATIKLTRESLSYAESAAIAGAFGLPAYQSLIKACKPRTDFQPSAARIVECAKIGRTLASKGSTLIANRIGFAVLRVSGTYTDEDVKLARTQDWILQAFGTLVANVDFANNAEKFIAHSDDANATGAELEAMRRELVRADQPTEPPANWVDKRSPFSRERLQQDRASAGG